MPRVVEDHRDIDLSHPQRCKRIARIAFEISWTPTRPRNAAIASATIVALAVANAATRMRVGG